jgi:hypothetical protein
MGRGMSLYRNSRAGDIEFGDGRGERSGAFV